MEDYEAHEQEFFAKLEESEFTRSAMLRRSAAAAFGLTILGSSPSLAWAARRAAAAPPLKGTKANMKALVAAAKKEGHLNVIALPAGLGELRRAHLDVQQEVRHRNHE